MSACPLGCQGDDEAAAEFWSQLDHHDDGLTHGPIPNGMCVVRICRNQRCCNPDHMEVVTRGAAARMADNGRVPGDQIARFWSKVDKAQDCWKWTGTTNGRGYGLYQLTGPNRRRQVRAHRYAYEITIGPIPDGLVLDHLCRRTLCVNPAHLEPVTNVENVMRGNSQAAIAVRGYALPEASWQ